MFSAANKSKSLFLANSGFPHPQQPQESRRLLIASSITVSDLFDLYSRTTRSSQCSIMWQATQLAVLQQHFLRYCHTLAMHCQCAKKKMYVTCFLLVVVCFLSSVW